MEAKAHQKPYQLAAQMGGVLERESVQDSGIALGIILAQFILLIEKSDKGIDLGIQSIADDAKAAAKRIRSFRQ